MTISSGAGFGSQLKALPPAQTIVSALSAGFAATIVFTLFMWYAGGAIAGFPMDVSQMLAGYFGDNPMLGAMAHYLTGAIAYPAAYLLARGLLPESSVAKGLIFGIILWLGANIVLLPIIGTGIFMTGMFQGNALIAPLATSLIGHVAFGLVLAALTERLICSVDGR